MAEGLLRDRLARSATRPRVESAGLAALVGHPADPIAVELLAERGIDISGHRARQLTFEMLEGADLVIVMEAAHQRDLERLFPQLRGRVHRIGRFGGYDVPDPFRRNRAAFEQALALIERGLDDFAQNVFGS